MVRTFVPEGLSESSPVRSARAAAGALPNTGADSAGERWRDPRRSIPSFPLTFGPTRIVIPLARYRKYGSQPASRYSSS
jgi:hypothetical protein